MKYKGGGTENIPGFGDKDPWVPPIPEPKTFITIYDRFVLMT